MQGTIIAKRCHFQPLCLVRSYQRPWRFPYYASNEKHDPTWWTWTHSCRWWQVKVWRFCFWLSDIPRQTHTPYEMQCVGPEYYFPCHIIAFAAAYCTCANDVKPVHGVAGKCGYSIFVLVKLQLPAEILVKKFGSAKSFKPGALLEASQLPLWYAQRIVDGAKPTLM